MEYSNLTWWKEFIQVCTLYRQVIRREGKNKEVKVTIIENL